MNNNQRNVYIDVMKGLLIILVVIGHLPYFDYDSRTLVLIYSFHMPAFLIIGGMLSHIKSYTKLSTILYKRIKGTLIPYFLFSLITFLIVPVGSSERLMTSVIAALKGIGDPVNSLNLPLWFLTFYFIAMLLFEIIEWISYRIKSVFFTNDSYLPIAIINLLFIVPIMYFSYIYARVYKMPRIPFNVEIACFSLLFVYIGKLISVYIKKAILAIKENKYLSFLFITISLFVIIVCTIYWYRFSMYNGRIDLNARDYKNAFLMYVDGILGFTIFAYFSYIISLIPLISNFFAVLGENSIYILAYHIPSVFYTNTFILPVLPQIVGITLSQNSIISIILSTSFGILFSLVFALIHKGINNLT